MEEKIILIDLSGIFYKHWHVSADKEFNTARKKTIFTIENLIRGYNYAAVAVDYPPYKRCKIYPEYKANRQHDPILREQLRETAKELKSIGIECYASKGYEADDILATLYDQAVDKGVIPVVASGDKDLLQLQCKVIDPFTSKERTSLEVFGCKPDEVHDVLTLAGDTSDNIPGVPGIGVKTAVEIICNTRFSLSLENFDYALLPEKYVDKIKNNIHKLKVSYDLVSLNYHVPIELKLVKYNTRKIINMEVDTMEEAKEFIEQEITKEKEDVTNEIQQVEPVVREQVNVPSKIIKTEWEKNLEPVDSTGAWKLANLLHESRMFGDYPNPQSVLAIMLRGRSLGIDSVSSLSTFYVVKGRPTMSADLMVGLVLRSGKCEYFEPVESDETHATWATKRVGSNREQVHTYTIEHAQDANIAHLDQWKKRPEIMLNHRCSAELARKIYPDVVCGLYTPDEIEQGL
jgi:5'-3' exonuclease